MSNAADNSAEDDALLIDSFFLPGGILDPDDQDDEASSSRNIQLSHFSSVPITDLSRVPKNPWKNDLVEESSTPQSQAEDSPFLAHLFTSSSPVRNHTTSENFTLPTRVLHPPPGYTQRIETTKPIHSHPIIPSNSSSFLNEMTNPHFSVPNSQHLAFNTPGLRQQPPCINDRQLTASSYTTSAVLQAPPITGLADSPISTKDNVLFLERSEAPERPKSRREEQTDNVKRIVTPVISNESDIYDDDNNNNNNNNNDGGENGEFLPVKKFACGTTLDADIITKVAKPNFSSPPLHVKHPLGTDNPYMAFLDPDDDEEDGEEENDVIIDSGRMGHTIDIGTGSRETATDIDSSDMASLVDAQEVVGQAKNEDDLEDSSGSESTFPLHTLLLTVLSSASSMSSFSEESSDGQEPKQTMLEGETGESQCLDEGTQALNSEVAVVLDTKDNVENVSLVREPPQLKRAKTENIPKKNKTPKGKIASRPRSSAAKRIHNANEKDKNHETLLQPNIRGEERDAKNSKDHFNLRSAADKYLEAFAVFSTAGQGLLLWILKCLSSIMIVMILFCIQACKFSMVEVFEEPHVALSYIVFYGVPHACLLLSCSFIVPHWSPQLIAGLAVWLLSGRMNAKPVFPEVSSFRDVSKIFQRQSGQIPLPPRLIDEQICEKLLQCIRYSLPFLFVVDGYSSEFGTLMNAKGSIRLSTSFLFLLTRKRILSSPIGWVSYALQGLLATYFHKSNALVEFCILVTGLSTIRLIRYLNIEYALNGDYTKKSQ